jgi:hypothetical protein
MSKYKVMLEGKNFLLNLEGSTRKYGFYVTRYVEANDPEQAELNAVKIIREDRELRKSVKNDRSDPPMIYLESIDELNSFEGIHVPGTGFTFYLDGGSE